MYTNDDNRRLFDEASQMETLLHDMRSIDTDTAYAQVHATIRRRHRHAVFQHAFRRVAAIMLLPLVAATATLLYMYTRKPVPSMPTAMVEIVSPGGAMARVTLPDSSEVWLNADSRLSYPQTFTGDDRTVTLTGEAFFSVRSDRRHPFYVQLADGLRVMAHGTRFNVCSYADERNAEMTLERGAIDIQHGDKTLCALAPDEQMVYDRQQHSYTLRRVNTEEYGSWKDGRLVFRDMPLEKVFEQIGRRFSTTIKMHDRSLAECKIRAIFDGESLPQILDAIQLVAPIRWSSATAAGTGGKPRIDIYRHTH